MQDFQKVVTRRVDDELNDLKREIHFLNQLKSEASLKKASFYYEIYLSHSHIPEVVVIGKDYQKVVADGKKKAGDKPTHWAKHKLYVLLPVTLEVIAYIGRVGVPGKSLLSGSGLTTRMLMEDQGFSLIEVEMLESSIAFLLPEKLWRAE